MTAELDPLPPPDGLTRRSFMTWSSLAGASVAVAGTVAADGRGLVPLTAAAAPKAGGTTAVWGACVVNCGSRCPLIYQVADGRIVRVDVEPTGDDEVGSQQIRACVRGRSIRHRIYHPDRLKYPMRRVPGARRGEGKFERISWDEALDAIAASLTSILKEHGPEAVYLNYGTGTLGGTVAKSWPPSATPIARLMNLLGGYLNHYSDYSTAQITSAYPFHYGTWVSSNSFDDMVHSKLVVYWGNNPTETRMSGGGENFVTLTEKQKSGAKVIVVDPRLSDTAVAQADEWVPLRPGSDPALVAGLAHVMISEELHDQAFLDKYCVGFDEDHLPAGAPAGSSYRSYVLGDGPDGTPKTPEWAAQITGVPAATIVRLAREIAQAKPCNITQGWGPQRHAAGENSARAIFTLAALTGNIGIPGGGTGGREASFGLPMAVFPTGENPVTTAISNFGWTEAIDHGPEMTALNAGVRGADRLKTGIKFIWNYASNTLVNQHADHNRTGEILADETKCEMIVVIDNQLTVSARYADILLPDVSNAEQDDLAEQGSAGSLGYTVFQSKAIEPMYECRTIYDMMAQLADRMGVGEKFTEGKSQEDWLRQIVAESRQNIPDLPNYEDLKAAGIWKTENPDGPIVPLADFRADPVKNKLDTPSGLIEIYSAQLAEIGAAWELADGDRITALPEYVPTWEGSEEARRADATYPLQMISHHYKQRTHSTYGNVDWMVEAHPQQVWVNPADARARGIAPDDLVTVWNDRGKVRIRAKVTPRIAPGVVSLPEGGWFTPDADGVDTGGSPNTLTSLRPSPLARGNAQHTALVQIEKA